MAELAVPARRLAQHLGVDGLDAERLRGRPVHDDVDPQDLHRVEGRREAAYARDRDERERRDGRAQLEAHEVADVCVNALALLYRTQQRREIVVEEHRDFRDRNPTR